MRAGIELCVPIRRDRVDRALSARDVFGHPFTGRRSRRPGRVSAVVLAAALCLPVALSAGAVSQAREAQAAAVHVIRATPALSPPLRPPRLVVRHRSSGGAPGYLLSSPRCVGPR